MLKIIKLLVPRCVIKIFKNINSEYKLYKNISKKYGHYKTVKLKQCIDSNNAPIPWYTYPSIEYLEQFDFSDKLVFEWGCGNSTLYWSERCKKIVSIEDNQIWFENINKKINDVTELHLIKKKEMYINKINEFNHKFDIIIVDAKYRDECLGQSINKIKDDGFIILDNSDRYPEICNKIRKSDEFIQIDFHGFGPIVNFTTTTSIFFTRKYNPKVINQQPKLSISGIEGY